MCSQWLVSVSPMADNRVANGGRLCPQWRMTLLPMTEESVINGGLSRK